MEYTNWNPWEKGRFTCPRLVQSTDEHINPLDGSVILFKHIQQQSFPSHTPTFPSQQAQYCKLGPWFGGWVCDISPDQTTHCLENTFPCFMFKAPYVLPKNQATSPLLLVQQLQFQSAYHVCNHLKIMNLTRNLAVNINWGLRSGGSLEKCPAMG